MWPGLAIRGQVRVGDPAGRTTWGKHRAAKCFLLLLLKTGCRWKLTFYNHLLYHYLSIISITCLIAYRSRVSIIHKKKIILSISCLIFMLSDKISLNPSFPSVPSAAPVFKPYVHRKSWYDSICKCCLISCYEISCYITFL